MSRRNVTDGLGAPFASKARTTIADCAPPSWLIASGVAVIPNDSANSDGPESGGGSVLWTVHAVHAIAHRMTIEQRTGSAFGMASEVPEVSKVDQDGAGDADVVAHLIASKKCDVGDGGHDGLARDELHE